MNREVFWTALDEVCASPDKSQSLLQVSDLLKKAYSADLPLLIACTRTPGRIHHSFTYFDASNPDLAGNRYLICFTNPGQAHLKAPTPVPEGCEEGLSLEERFRQIDKEAAASSAPRRDGNLSLAARFQLIDEGGDVSSPKKPHRKRKRAKSTGPMWKTSEEREIASVSTRKILDYVRKSKAVGGLIFNVYDEKHSVALPKFMIE